MDPVVITHRIDQSASEVFDRFVNETVHWWPKEYTWSGDALKSFTIDLTGDRLCSEIGPHAFRCDWGRVLAVETNRQLILSWQIGPNREPVPDPDKASTVTVDFIPKDEMTDVRITHDDFDRYGEEAQRYHDGMASEYGWAYILSAFVRYCQA